MKTILQFFRRAAWLFAVIAAVVPPVTVQLYAQGASQVTTIGGGGVPGNQVGGNDFSLFNTPWGIGVQGDQLFIADFANNQIKVLRLVDLKVSTFVNVTQPLALAVDGQTNLFVISANSGTIRRYDAYGNFRGNFYQGLNNPRAIALSTNGLVYVAERNGVVRQLAPIDRQDPSSPGQEVAVYSAPGRIFEGVAVFSDGRVAVSDLSRNVILVFQRDGSFSRFAGVESAGGFANGDNRVARFNGPHHIARGPNDTLVVADRYNHRIRLVSCDGITTTLWGIAESEWYRGSEPGVFPGWADGSPDFAESREPVGVAVTPSGTVYDSEVYYHLIREGTGFIFPSCSGVDQVIPTPVLNPNSGYYPMGARITVSSVNGFPRGTVIHYTTDGTAPTTNSPSITQPNPDGTFYIPWRESRVDLSSLRVRAFLEGRGGEAASGVAVSFGSSGIEGEVGIPRLPDQGPLLAGLGSQAYILPIVANVRAGQRLRSLQLVVEITAPPGARRLERTDVQILSISSNDFVQVLPASTNLPNRFSTVQGQTHRLAVAYIGTNANFTVNGSATVAMLGLQFRTDADTLGQRSIPGDEYVIRVVDATGTSDGVQSSVLLRSMPDQVIRLRNLEFLSGDTAPGFWYNAGDFGDIAVGNPWKLYNSDVNNAIFASLGFRKPYDFSDAFFAMDVTRDLVIDFNDAETILRRALGFDNNNFKQYRSPNGNWVYERVGDDVTASIQSLRAASIPETTSVWNKDIFIKAGIIAPAYPGARVRVPVTIQVDPGKDLFGMQFVADVVPEHGAPAATSIAFNPGELAPDPSMFGSSVPGLGTLPNTVYARWNYLEPGLKGTVQLGTIDFSIPVEAVTGQAYSIVLHHATGGSIDDAGALIPRTFEVARGAVYLYSSASATFQTSDDWKTYFFGDVTAPGGSPDQDADKDGLTNYEEFLVGTNPKTTDWLVQVNNNQVKVRWVGHVGKRYILESTENFNGWNAVTGILTGQDSFLEHNELITPSTRARFYRIKVEP